VNRGIMLATVSYRIAVLILECESTETVDELLLEGQTYAGLVEEIAGQIRDSIERGDYSIDENVSLDDVMDNPILLGDYRRTSYFLNLLLEGKI